LADGPPVWTLETFTAGDGYRWHYRRYPPAGPARGRVVFVHGIQSHAGWYEHSCTWLGQQGFEVFFLDRRGSGSNRQNRGDAPGFRRLLDDVAELLSSLRSAESGSPCPVFLAGISWGGKLVAALQKRHSGLVDGLILLCPGFFARVRPSRRQRLGILWARLVKPTGRFLIPLSDPELFTASPHWQQFLREDPLTLHEATARLLIESVRLDYYLQVVPKRVRVPVLLLLAEHDRIIANAPTRRFVESFATTDKEVIEYPDAHHTLEFEPKPDLFLNDVRCWLERHIASPGALFHVR
jgi:alpha-beta hydrolase superfamily lysophospholipase